MSQRCGRGKVPVLLHDLRILQHASASPGAGALCAQLLCRIHAVCPRNAQEENPSPCGSDLWLSAADHLTERGRDAACDQSVHKSGVREGMGAAPLQALEG